MSIFSPQQRDFLQIIEDIGQTITIRTVTRTVDTDGLTTGVTNVDLDISAIVDEVDDKRTDLLEGGYYKIGDIKCHIDPNTVVEVFDKIVWDGVLYSVKTKYYPQKIAGHRPYMELHCVKNDD